MTVLHAGQDIAALLWEHWGKALIAFVLTRAVYRRYVHPLRHVPGPWLASITSLWLAAVQFSPRHHWIYVDLHRKASLHKPSLLFVHVRPGDPLDAQQCLPPVEWRRLSSTVHQYGPVIRISPYRVMFTSPETIHDYFGWDKSDYWKAFQMNPHDQGHGTHLIARDHRIEKAKISGAYTLTNILKSENKVDGHILELLDQFATKTNTPFDFAPWMQYFGWDVVMDVTMSKLTGFVKQGYDIRGQIASLHSLLTISLIMGLFPAIPQFLNHKWWYPLLSPRQTAKTGIGAIIGFAYNAVDERFTNPDLKKPDLVQYFVDYRDHKSGEALSQARIQQEALPAVLAGSDTTASTLRSMLLHICSNPRIYNKLMSQIDAADDAGLLSTPPTYDQVVKHIPYMDCIRKEALRILPAASSIFFRVSPFPSGTHISGHFIPPGTEVGIAHWPIARSEVYFGADCNLFRPERWTDDNDTTDANDDASTAAAAAERKKMRDLGDVFFSDGVFMCTGRHLAIMELMKMPVEFLRRFELEVVNVGRPWVERGANAMLHEEFWVVLRERRRKGRRERGGDRGDERAS